MHKYIIVKVRDANEKFPSRPYRDPVTGKWTIPSTNLAKIRRAIHKEAKEQFISEADIVTNTVFMSDEDSATISEIFERNLANAKRGYRP